MKKQTKYYFAGAAALLFGYGVYGAYSATGFANIAPVLPYAALSAGSFILGIVISKK